MGPAGFDVPQEVLCHGGRPHYSQSHAGETTAVDQLEAVVIRTNEEMRMT